MLGKMYRWCVIAFSSGLWKIPTLVDQLLDSCIVHVLVKINILCEQRWLCEQHSGKKFRHFFTCCVSKDHWDLSACSRTQIICISGKATTYTTTLQAQLLWCPERFDWSVKWHSVVFSDKSRFCLYASDGCTCVRRRLGERHLLECIRP